MRGQKWLDGASYLTPGERERIAYAIAQAKAEGKTHVGVRAAATNAAVAVVTYGPGGGSIYCMVYPDRALNMAW